MFKKIFYTSFISLLTPALMHGYSLNLDVAVECHSASGRTLLSFNNPSLGHTMTNGKLTIDNKSLSYDFQAPNATNAIVNDLRQGIYTLYYKDEEKKLSFHSIPKSVKKINSRLVKANYIFNAIVMIDSTDPRKMDSNHDKTLDYNIQVECALEILTKQK